MTVTVQLLMVIMMLTMLLLLMITCRQVRSMFCSITSDVPELLSSTIINDPLLSIGHFLSRLISIKFIKIRKIVVERM